MCGIVGIYTRQSLRENLYDRIKKLQHRGQDSYGYSDGEKIQKHLGMIEIPPENLQGNIGIAHTRYRTSGEVNLDLSQPFLKNGISLVHNGNITNLEGESDSLGLLNFILEKIENGILQAIKSAIDHCEGSFFCILTYKGDLYAFKDNCGIRPGRVYKSPERGDIIIASETEAGAYDICAGEILSVSKAGVISSYYGSSFLKPCIFEYIYLAKPDSVINGKSVKEFRLSMAVESKKLIEQNSLEIDAVFCIPRSSRIYGEKLAKVLKKPYLEPTVNEVKRTFILPTQKERENFMEKKFSFLEDYSKYEKILVVDDSLVRGTTAKFIIRCLRKRGVKKIYFFSFSPKVINTNSFGIHIVDKKELVSYNKTHRQIEEFIGCDKLIYQTIENLHLCSGFKNLELSIYKTKKEKSIDEVFECYERFGESDYIGERVTQLEHATQAAVLAEKHFKNDKEIVLGAFLHDIGHLLNSDKKMGKYGASSHEKTGADFLRTKGFPEKTTEIVENHILSKRYLIDTDKDYFENLSDASKKTYQFQGGSLTPEEKEKFTKSFLFSCHLKIREFDDLAKKTDKEFLEKLQKKYPIEYYKKMAYDLIIKQKD